MSASGKLPKILTEGELTALLDQFNTRHRTPHRDRLMVELMAQAGLRVSEVCDLRPEHVRWDTCRVLIRDSKGAQDRIVWISDDLRDRIAGWYEQRHDGGAYLFDTNQATRVDENHLRRRVKRAAREAEIDEWKRVSPHTLRHTFATRYLRAVGNVEKVRRALGHADISTTQIYLHLADEDLEESMRAFANER